RVVAVTEFTQRKKIFIAGWLLNSVAVARINQVNPLRVGKRVCVNFLKRGELGDDSPTAIARLNRRIDGAQDRAGRAMEEIFRVIFAGRKFYAEPEADVSIVKFRRIEQPHVADQSKIANAGRARGV